MSDENKTVDGVDLSKLTADQLISLSEEEWNEFYSVVKAAIAAKKAEAQAKVKAKIQEAVTVVNTYILPVVKYVAGAAIMLKVFGVI
ncbi:Hypothetical protein LUCI_3426 [Lucifera butyrica]|uniref:Uncharacterized protein n=1 Tax=Lucifera butyrica TaxID=1351585 RepID=A0A498R9V5_9FIRM|nr:hypothetical protein [Lucifera butyrica]VBB08161.1 Hypothetical protein LUCI_3426 [Lucifera butyrica]